MADSVEIQFVDEKVKKAARENNPNLREMLTSLRFKDLVPSCFEEAMLEASRGGHMDAICSLVITGGRHSLKFKDCINEALKIDACDAGAMLLTCYAAKHNKKKLLKYLVSVEVDKENEQEALAELTKDLVLTVDALSRMRMCISDKDVFNIAVPIGLAIQQKKKDAVEIFLLSTNCNQVQKQINWCKLVLSDIDPSWLENITWVENLFLASNLLTSVPSNITILTKLCCLDLRRNQLKTIPASLLEMSSLRDLRLSENKIVQLPEKCKWSPSLKTLTLNDNSLETLPKSMAVAKLSILYIARNNLYEVPLCICAITTLQSLDLSGNPRLTQLPPQMGRLTNIEMLKLENLDQLTDPPEEIKRNGIKTIMYLQNILHRSEGTTLKHRLMRNYSYNENKSTNVPPEILARGPLALEAYKTALTEGKTHVKRVPVMLIGQERAGKTSLQKSLKGKPFEPDEGSTVGINVDPSHFKLSTEIWKLGEEDPTTNSGRTISYEYHAARLTVENLRQNKGTPEKKHPESLKSGSIPLVDTVSVTLSSDLQSEPSASNVPSDHEKVDINDFTLGASTAAVPGTNSDDSETFHDISKDARLGEVSRDSEEIETSRDPHNADFIPDMPEDTATLVEMFLKEDNKVVEEEEEIYSVLWDFAGQSVYYTTHPVFLTPRAIYLLVNNLSQNPQEKAKPVVKRGIFRKLEDTFNVKTSLDYLDLWMSSIASLAIEGESREVNPQSEVLPGKLPPVFLVCTHADKPYDNGDPYELAQDVFGSLRNKPHKSHLYDDVFVVDNTKSGHEVQCPEVARLRKEILDVAKELPHLKEPIPIKWLRYEKALEARREDGDNWIPLDSAKQIASEECNITDEKQFRTLLDFLHDQRILIHFSDTPKLDTLVVLDPQWLIDVFKKVITIKPFDRKEKKFEQLWCKLEERGILEEKLLKHAWDTLFDNKETIESLIEIMEKFSLLCLWPSSDVACDKQYLVPSMLMSQPPEGITQLITSAQVPPLFLRFESGQVPLGLFPRLVLQFFQWGKDKYMSTVDPQLHHNFARFYTLKNSSVILLCHSSSIEVVVHEGNPTLELAESLQSENVGNDTFVVSCAHEVRRQLGLFLESMRNEFCWLKSMKYEERFLCPVCCQGREIYYCRKHCARGCKQEECLHFWSESDLRNVDKNLCTKSAVAEGPSVQVEQFAPWLAPVGNQLTPGESDGRSVTSVEGSEEIAIPDQVLEALLSQSCDAKEIVLQLRETIKVENASLKQPDSETKTLIRCLAKKAKESNRLDVFQHLREITPAGCSGPLLPDLLDIRNMPVSKARELTIDLSGGHEWQVVAEGLGLTPLEIRFLDSRTLNPFDAALSFIARQRHITVGNLYDLLNELGFPVIADRRL